MILINLQKCCGCGLCARECPRQLIAVRDGKALLAADNCIKCGHCFAVCPSGAIEVMDMDDRDVDVIADSKPCIEADKLLSAMKRRRSIRKFTDEKVKENEIEMIFDAARHAPTGQNLQEVEFILVQDKLPELTEKVLGVLNNYSRKVPETASAYTKQLQKDYGMWWQVMDWLYKEEGKDALFFHAPTVLVITAPNQIDASIAAAYAELETYALGLGCCYIGYLKVAAEDEDIMNLLEVKQGHRVVCALAIGHPDVTFLRTTPVKPKTLKRL